MNRFFASICLAVLAMSIMLTETSAEEKQPNLVFIIADDCTFRDIGCYGGQAHTPNIDGLAKEGMKFNRCFQTAPMCSPTRHNIYTGLYPVKSGAYPNHTFAKPGTKSIVHYLKPLGYRVALSGKKHIATPDIFPFEYSVADKNPDMKVIDQLFEDSKGADTPFCLFACSNEPHTPWNKGDASAYPPAENKLPPYIADTPFVREQFSKYLAEITYYDDQVGQILDLLDKHDLSSNTLVMVVSEQGNSLPFAKWTCHEMGLGSAMIVRWPGKVEAGSETDAMVEYCDVTSTFVEAAGGTPAAVLDGKSFLQVLLGKTDHHKDVTFGLMTTHGIINGNECYPIRSIRDDKYRLIWNLNFGEAFRNACTQSKEFQSMLEAAAAGDERAKWATDHYQNRPEFQLFDVTADPMEMNNLAANPKYRDIIAGLKSKLDAWMQEQGDLGIETELNAFNHQTRALKKRKGRNNK
jgi:arylsulfatase A-like enzyme